MDDKTIQEETSITPFWSERNLLVLPFFVLDRDSDVQEIEYKGVVRENNRDIAFQWNVHSTNLGMPRIFDWQVHRAIEEILSGQPLPIINPVAFSVYELIEHLGIPHSGASYRRVRESILRIMGTLIRSQAAFYLKSQEERLTDAFHIYDRAVFKDDRLEDGTVADTNYLWLGSWYIENLNLRYSKPLDRDYYRSLKMPLAKRIYEIVGVKFFGLPDRYTPLRQNYVEFCQLLGTEPKRYLSYAKRRFSPAHRELVESKFLVNAELVKGGRQPGDWYFVYKMGDRAVAEIEQARSGTHLPPMGKARKVIGRRPFNTETSEERHPLVAQLVKREVLLKVAIELVNQYPEEKIQEVIDYMDWYVVATNRVKKLGAYITRLIKDPDFAVSADYLRAKESSQEEQARQELLEQAQGIRERRLQQALENWDDERYLVNTLEEMRQRHRHMEQWVQRTTEDVEAEIEKIRTRMPGDEEGRITELQKYEYFQVRAILKELKGGKCGLPPEFAVPHQSMPVQEASVPFPDDTDQESQNESQLSFLELAPTE